MYAYWLQAILEMTEQTEQLELPELGGYLEKTGPRDVRVSLARRACQVLQARPDQWDARAPRVLPGREGRQEQQALQDRQENQASPATTARTVPQEQQGRRVDQEGLVPQVRKGSLVPLARPEPPAMRAPLAYKEAVEIPDRLARQVLKVRWDRRESPVVLVRAASREPQEPAVC